MNKFIALISLLSLSFLSTHLMAKTYCWKDDQGATVCSDTKPADGRDVKVMAPPPPPAESPEEARKKLDQQIQQLNEDNEKRLAEKKAAAEKQATGKHSKEQCANARKNLELINNRPPQTLFKTGDGEYKRFTPDERAEQIKQANEAIEKYCK